MDFDITTSRENYQKAKKDYDEAILNDKKAKKSKKDEKLKSLNENEQKLINEYYDTYNSNSDFGTKIRRLIFFICITTSIVLWFLFVKNSEIKFLPYLLITTIISSIVAFAVAFICNKEARVAKKRRIELLKNKVVSDYFTFCREVDESEGDELKSASEKLDIAAEELYIATNVDTVFIYLHHSMTNDSATLYKALSLHIDGKLYRERMTPGVTKIKLEPGYHFFRFEAFEQPISDGVVAAFREGYYGSSSTSREFSCQIDTTNRHPAGIVIDKKGDARFFENMSLEQYIDYFDKK